GRWVLPGYKSYMGRHSVTLSAAAGLFDPLCLHSARPAIVGAIAAPGRGPHLSRDKPDAGENGELEKFASGPTRTVSELRTLTDSLEASARGCDTSGGCPALE